MRFFNFIKKYKVETIFILLIMFFGYLYFVVYMTKSRVLWYNDMVNQINYIVYELTHIRR